MKLTEAATLLSAGAAWHLVGARAAGRRLVSGLASSDENNRVMAGMLLARGGTRAVPLLREELEHPRNLPLLLRVMNDAAPLEFRPVIERFTTSDDPHVARAAREALRSSR